MRINKVQMPDTRWSKYKLHLLHSGVQPDGVISRSKGPLVQQARQLLRKAGSQLCNSRREVAVGVERKKEGEAVGLRGRSRRALMALREVREVRAASEKSHPGGYRGCLVLSGPSAGENSRKLPMSGCAAGGKDLLPGHLEPPLKKSHRQRKGRTKGVITELSGCFHQPNGRVTAYFIYLQLNPEDNTDQNPKNQQKSFSYLTFSLTEKYHLKNVTSYCKLAPNTLNFAPLSSVQFCTCLVLFSQHPVCSPEIHTYYLTTLPGSALCFSSFLHAPSHDSLLLFLCLLTLRWC